jgi:hypothetical protein
MEKIHLKISQFMDAGAQSGVLVDGLKENITSGKTVVIEDSEGNTIKEFTATPDFDSWFEERFKVTP